MVHIEKMTQLVRTDVMYDTEMMPAVGFDTDEGAVDIVKVDGVVVAKIAFEEVSAAEARDVLEDVEDSEYFPAEAAELAHDLLDDLADQDDEADWDANSDDAQEDDGDQEGDVVHTMDDGTEIRVGDRINHPGGWSYKICGEEGEHTLVKSDNTDDWGVVKSTVERDIREHGFDERVEEEKEKEEY
jgi:hypothetical protein